MLDILFRASVEGCRLGIGHAIISISDYALDHPDSQSHCDALIAVLRRQSASLGSAVQE